MPPVRSGNYEVTLRMPVDGLFAGEEMQLEYRVVDASRVDPVMGAAPIIRAVTRSVIEMPSMPSMAKIVETAHPEGIPGEYGVHPWFPHGGEYLLQLHITPPGGEQFSVRFPLVVGDAVEAKNKKRLPPPYFVEMKASPKSPKAGQEVELEFAVRSRALGDSVVKEFDIQHEKPMHLLIARKDLGVFAHEHPEPADDGKFRLRYRFSSGGEYHLFVDAAPKGAGGKVMLTKLKVGGVSTAGFSIGQQKAGEPAQGDTVEITWQASEYPSGRTLRMHASVKDRKAAKAVIDLEPYLGALGHLILIHEDGETFVHSHPDELADGHGQSGQLVFLARFPKEGRYRGWAQVKRAGTVETAAFVVDAVKK